LIIDKLGIETADNLKNKISQLINERKAQLIVIDFKNTDLFGVPIINALLDSQRMAGKQGIKIALLGLAEDTRNFLRLATVDKLFQIYEDRSQIVKKIEVGQGFDFLSL